MILYPRVPIILMTFNMTLTGTGSTQYNRNRRRILVPAQGETDSWRTHERGIYRAAE